MPWKDIPTEERANVYQFSQLMFIFEQKDLPGNVNVCNVFLWRALLKSPESSTYFNVILPGNNNKPHWSGGRVGPEATNDDENLPNLTVGSFGKPQSLSKQRFCATNPHWLQVEEEEEVNTTLVGVLFLPSALPSSVRIPHRQCSGE